MSTKRRSSFVGLPITKFFRPQNDAFTKEVSTHDVGEAKKWVVSGLPTTQD
jgi:hypothetical protein